MKERTLYNKILLLIKENPDKKWTLEEMAGNFGYSPYHFHRMFKKLMGETFQAFMDNQRLSYSAKELSTSAKRIIDVAMDYNFGSHEVYTRLFKKNFHMPPSSIRNKQDVYAFFEKNFLLDVPEESAEVRIEYIPNFAYKPLKIKDGTIKTAGNLWVKLIEEYEIEPDSILIGLMDPKQSNYVLDYS